MNSAPGACERRGLERAGTAGQRVVVPLLGVELDEPLEPLVPLLPELPIEDEEPAEPLEPEVPGEVLPLLPMLVEPPDPLLEGELVLPPVPAVLLPDLVPAVSLPPWPHAASAMAPAAITVSAAPREKREAFIWISLVAVWEDEGTRGQPWLPAPTLGLPGRWVVVWHCRTL